MYVEHVFLERYEYPSICSIETIFLLGGFLSSTTDAMSLSFFLMDEKMTEE